MQMERQRDRRIERRAGVRGNEVRDHVLFHVQSFIGLEESLPERFVYRDIRLAHGIEHFRRHVLRGYLQLAADIVETICSRNRLRVLSAAVSMR
jgi:hypothetical protein